MGETEGVLLPEGDAGKLARLVPAAPAVASAALRATRLAGGEAKMARLIVEGVARAVNGGALPAPEREHDTLYDPALVNADCDLIALCDRLVRPGADRAVSFLLSGPPGAEKSALDAPFGCTHGIADVAEAGPRYSGPVCRRNRT
jgi:transitional endoplasmic reticulum ATPase